MASPFSDLHKTFVSNVALFGSNRFDIGRDGCGIITIAITAGFSLPQFSAHMAGTFTTLRCAAMETEYFRRTCRSAFFGSTANVFFLKRITNADIHGAIAISY